MDDMFRLAKGGNMSKRLRYKRSKVSIFLISFCSIGILLILVALLSFKRNVDDTDRSIRMLANQVLISINREENLNKNMIADFPMVFGSEVIVFDENGLILASTDNQYNGINVSDLAISIENNDYKKCSFNRINKKLYRSYFVESSDLVVGLFVVCTQLFSSVIDATLLSLVFLIVVDAVITVLMGRSNQKIMEVNDERDRQLEILTSMSDIYNSMHLLDLDDDTIVEYKSNDSIRRLANPYDTAHEQLRAAMNGLIVEKYREKALEFTDITTLSERLKGKKMIYDEFLGINKGWIRSSFIKISEHEDNSPKLILYTTLVIDAEKRKEIALLYKSNTDELTKVLNRHAYEDALAEHNKRGLYDDFAIVMLDVNGLKCVNDALGHAAGDELLIGASQCITSVFGKYGKVYRLGGDEFCVIVDSHVEDAAALFDEFRVATNAWKGQIIDSLSVSAGIAFYKEIEGQAITELEKLADRRMYKAKKQYYQEAGIDKLGM